MFNKITNLHSTSWLLEIFNKNNLFRHVIDMEWSWFTWTKGHVWKTKVPSRCTKTYHETLIGSALKAFLWSYEKIAPWALQLPTKRSCAGTGRKNGRAARNVGLWDSLFLRIRIGDLCIVWWWLCALREISMYVDREHSTR